MRVPRIRSTLPAICSLLVAAAGGCDGSARIEFISLHHSAIDPPQVQPWRFDAQVCRWWLDEAGNLSLGISCRRSNILVGRLADLELCLWLRLDTPPAGSGRDYQLKPEQVRLLLRTPLQRQTFLPMGGIVSVITDDDGSYHGSFRLWLQPIAELNILSILPDRPGPMLCFGSFKAVKEQGLGKELRGRFDSPAAPLPAATSPSTQPSVRPIVRVERGFGHALNPS